MNDRRILLIDDDAELCEELAEILKDEGYSVELTTDSLKGMSLAKKYNYNIIILDFKMPNLTGVDILKQINLKNRKTQVFIITGKPFIEKILEEENLTNFVKGIINKPFDYKILLEKIKN